MSGLVWKFLIRLMLSTGKGDIQFGKEGLKDSFRPVSRDTMQVQDNRGGVNWSLGKYRKAIHNLDKVIGRDPENAQAYARRALAYAAIGKNREAKRDFHSAVALGFGPELLKAGINLRMKLR